MSEAETILNIPVSQIDASGRIRPIDEDKAQGIAASVRKIGLLHPLDVCRLPGRSDYKLVCGGTRLRAVQIAGLETVSAIVRSNDALDRLEREIAENLFRNDLSPLDRAAFVSRLIEVEKARAGIAEGQDGRALNADKRSAKVLKKQQIDDLCRVHKSLGLQENVAAKFGLSQSSVSRDLALNGIAAELLGRVRKLAIAGNAGQLRALAKMKPEQQVEAVKLIESGQAKNVSHAAGIIMPKRVEPLEERLVHNFLGNFERMTAWQKGEALRLLVEKLPAGWSLKATKPREKLPTNADIQAAVDAQAAREAAE